MSTPIFPQAVWDSGTNQNAVPANDNSLRNEAINRKVISKTTTAQPGSPADGAVYVIPASATGAQWATFTAGDVAIYRSGTWYAFSPVAGVVLNINGTLEQWTGSAWAPLVAGSGDVVGPSSSAASNIALFDGTTGKLLKDAGLTIDQVKAIIQNSQSGAYTLVATDAGKHILHPSADTTPRTFTIPANSSVAFPIGTAISFVNQNAAGTLTIGVTSDTMRLAGAGSTGNRTLAANGVATALKIASTEWIISGNGLT
ncbi:DUF2793 domain-containing protein [Luteibacter sp.]|uniref:DUF2793 domain-containing protein n=1 Tax=Luteibacter sp. TaxID=1886636 RepID=UPI0028091887|nr:DUF2793 domain-containing protein [Luteibacter sp.]MDQ8051068.1 DUF2793 domain-containing protein [Luteibacter sp.]